MLWDQFESVLVHEICAQLLFKSWGDRHQRCYPMRLFVLGFRHPCLIAFDERSWLLHNGSLLRGCDERSHSGQGKGKKSACCQGLFFANRSLNWTT
jgi:hypothetical protein